MFEVSDVALRRCLNVHHFELPRGDEQATDGLAFFGIRGAVPANTEFWDFAPKHPLVPKEVTHRSLSCTIGIWDQSKGVIAVFAGSTSPNFRAAAGSNDGSGPAANQMLESRVRYAKDVHRSQFNKIGYHAFVQDMKFALQRVRGDSGAIKYDFDADDVVESGFVGDNLHAASTESVDEGGALFSSFGCQVVIGRFLASTDGRPTLGGTKGWDRFVRHIYSLGQRKFVYYLLHCDDVRAAVESPPNSLSVRLRYGARSDLVSSVQQKLNAMNAAPPLVVDRDYGRATLLAVQKFQRTSRLLADCSVGPITARALGFGEQEWPKA